LLARCRTNGFISCRGGDAGGDTRGIGRTVVGREVFSIFNYPTLSWADISAIGWLVDGAAIMNLNNPFSCSYGPYARAMIRICRRNRSTNQGFEIMTTLAQLRRRNGAGPEPLVVASLMMLAA
jgi:1,2-phenylacetyl-CoA epoxidase catalytic subunit